MGSNSKKGSNSKNGQLTLVGPLFGGALLRPIFLFGPGARKAHTTHVISNRTRAIPTVHKLRSGEVRAKPWQNTSWNREHPLPPPAVPARPTSSDIILLKYIPRRDEASDYQTIRQHWDIIKIHSLPNKFITNH